MEKPGDPSAVTDETAGPIRERKGPTREVCIYNAATTLKLPRRGLLSGGHATGVNTFISRPPENPQRARICKGYGHVSLQTLSPTQVVIVPFTQPRYCRDAARHRAGTVRALLRVDL